jgi:hypothetical protein
LSRTAFDVAETDARADAPAMQHQYAEAKKKFGTAEKKYRTAQVSTPWVLYAVSSRGVLERATTPAVWCASRTQSHCGGSERSMGRDRPSHHAAAAHGSNAEAAHSIMRRWPSVAASVESECAPGLFSMTRGRVRFVRGLRPTGRST